MTDSAEPTLLGKVLVIDDEPGLRDMLVYGLRKRGYDVVCAPNGEEGLVKAQQGAFDLVVCDMMMPGVNGMEVLSRLKELSPAPEVVMATGFASLETAVASMKQGAYDYITKPYSLSKLCAIFDKALEHRALLARVGHLEELHHLKDEFMATISHELRTPITVIIGYITLMREKIYGAISPEQDQGLAIVDSKAKGLLQMINNIIDLTILSGRGTPLELQTCSITEVVEDAVTPFKTIAKEKKLEIVCHHPPMLIAETDAKKLRRIVTQLLDNAVKFTPKGRISVTLEAVDDTRFQLKVQDTGIGIALEDQAVIFQDFRQADGSRTRRFGGSGLGLAIARRFAELMGGTLVVESIVAQGSTFTAVLPGLRPGMIKEKKETAVVLQAESASSKLLMVVDDDPDFVRLFQSVLTREGYPVNTAFSGEEALSKMKSQPPYVVLLDLNMPGLTGFEVLKAMGEQPALKNVKVFIMTAKDLTQAESATLHERAELIIQKGSKELPEILALMNARIHETNGKDVPASIVPKVQSA